MKGNISLKEFIHQVRDELVEAQDLSKEPFYELDTVQLEVSFVLDITGGAKARLVVVELGGETKASQTHKVTLMLKTLPIRSRPTKKSQRQSPSGNSGGGGGGFGDRSPLSKFSRPVYAPNTAA
jgi:Trypsin-co-occurring domain 2